MEFFKIKKQTAYIFLSLFLMWIIFLVFDVSTSYIGRPNQPINIFANSMKNILAPTFAIFRTTETLGIIFGLIT